MGIGVLPTTHKLSLGMLGMHGAPYTNLALDECDLLIAAGARFDDRATGRLEAFCPDAAVIHIDIDAAELGKLRRPTVSIRADLDRALTALIPLAPPNPRSEWKARIGEIRARNPLSLPGATDPATPYGLILAVARSMPAGTVVTTDVGQHQMWVAQAFPFERPRSLLTSGGLGTMGFGLPAAIGAAISDPDRPVICFAGDGSLLMNIQELAVAAEMSANVKIIVMNNRSLGMVRQQQDLFYGNRRFASDLGGDVDFAAAARAFGVPGAEIEPDRDIDAQLQDWLRQPGPGLLNAHVDPLANVYPIVPPGAANRDMLVGDAGADGHVRGAPQAISAAP